MYTNIQLVVKPVWPPVWQTAVSCIQLVVKPVVQPSLATGWRNSDCSFNTVVKLVVWLYIDYEHSTSCQTRLTTGWMFVYTIQPVVQPVWQPVVSCKWGITVKKTLKFVVDFWWSSDRNKLPPFLWPNDFTEFFYCSLILYVGSVTRADRKLKNSNVFSASHHICVYRQKSMMMPEKTVNVAYQITAVML